MADNIKLVTKGYVDEAIDKNKKYVDDNILDYISLSYVAGPSGNQEATFITADNSNEIVLLNKDDIGIVISKGALIYNGPSNANLIAFNVDNYPIANEKYVDDAISTQVSSVYKAKGSIADLTALPTPDKDHEGFVYNIETEFTTTDQFVEGEGKTFPAGTNIVCINTTGTTYKWDVLAGMVDLSSYATKTELSGKLDKVTTTHSMYRVYIINKDGSQSTQTMSAGADSNSIAVRTDTGTIRVTTPTDSNDATTKKYVDDTVGDINTILATLVDVTSTQSDDDEQTSDETVLSDETNISDEPTI